VIVVGSVNVDLVARVDDLPTAGETTIGSSLERHHGGKGGNHAVAAARLGVPTFFVGAVGDDPFGADARAALAEEHVDISHLTVLDGQSTGVAIVIVDHRAENEIVVIPGANSSVQPDQVREALDQLALTDEDVILTSNEIPVEAVGAALSIARRAGARSILNPAPAKGLDPATIALADFVTPNLGELLALVGTVTDGLEQPQLAVLIEHATRLLSEYSCPDAPERAVVVTLGAAGALVVVQGERDTTQPPRTDGVVESPASPAVGPAPPGAAWTVPAVSVTPIDTTGAGDTFNGVLAACLAEGRGLREAAALAVAASGLATTRIGAREGMPRRSDLDAIGVAATDG
jgi:ribokinase